MYKIRLEFRNIDIDVTLQKVGKLLSEEKGLSPAMRSMVELLVLLITLLVGRLNRNSRNSSKPPSSDPNRQRESKAKGERKAGGQKGRDWMPSIHPPGPWRLVHPTSWPGRRRVGWLGEWGRH